MVLLERGERIRLEPVDPELAAAACRGWSPASTSWRGSAPAIAAVTAGGAWRLTLMRDPAAAIDALVRHFGLEVAGSPIDAPAT